MSELRAAVLAAIVSRGLSTDAVEDTERLKLDELDALELTLEIESETGVDLDDEGKLAETAMRTGTVGELIAIVEAKAQRTSAASEAPTDVCQALVDLAAWVEDECGAELPHAHIETAVATAKRRLGL